MIDSVYNTVNAISNKEQRGTLSPEKFNYLANMAVIEIYNTYDIAKYINKANRGFTAKGLNNMEKMEREKYEHFYVTAPVNISGATYPLPADCNYLESIYYAGRELEECNNRREFNLLANSEDFQASLDYPIYLRLGNTLDVFPTEIIGEIELYYTRQPLIPKWTYTMIGLVPMYNPSAVDFQDIDLHPAEQTNVVINILSQLGINLKEPELTQYAELLKNNQMQQEKII